MRRPNEAVEIFGQETRIGGFCFDVAVRTKRDPVLGYVAAVRHQVPVRDMVGVQVNRAIFLVVCQMIVAALSVQTSTTANDTPVAVPAENSGAKGFSNCFLFRSHRSSITCREKKATLRFFRSVARVYWISSIAGDGDSIGTSKVAGFLVRLDTERYNPSMDATKILRKGITTAQECMSQDPKLSELILQQLLKCDPEHREGLELLGLCKYQLGQYAESIDVFQRLLRLGQTQANVWNAIGLSYLRNGNPDLAESAIRTAITIEPDAIYYQNLGCLCGETGRFDEAKWCFTRAIEINPGCAEAHVERAFCYFLEGDWESGFREYEWRFQTVDQLAWYAKTYSPDKLWDGSSLRDKRFLVYLEQGLGDGIQFVRYVKEIKNRGAFVIVHTPRPLKPLLEKITWIDEVVTGEQICRCDYHSASMSLPRLLGDYEISGEPYLNRPDSPRSSQMFSVGVVWAGSARHPNDLNRSIPMSHFSELASPEVQLFSLQKGHKCGPEMTDLSPMIQTMDDTATLLAGLDLLITCDSAPAHLAGALGIPCWLLLPYVPDWRWGLIGSSTPWYRSVEIIRQNKQGDWTELFSRAKKKLLEWPRPDSNRDALSSTRS